MNALRRFGVASGISGRRRIGFAAIVLSTTLALTFAANPGRSLASNGTWSSTATTGAWQTTTNWVSGFVPGATSGTTNGDTATFNSGSTTTLIVPDLNRNLTSITFDTAATAYTIGTNGGNAILLSNDGFSPGTVQIANTFTGTNITETINAPLTLEANYIFADNSTNVGVLLSFGGPITNGSGSAETLSVSGVGNTAISGAIGGGTGSLGLSKSGAGTLTLTGADTYTGPTVVNGGTLQVGNGSVGNLNGTTGTALTFSGSGIFNVDEAASSAQGMGALQFSAGDGTVQSTFVGASATLTFSSYNRNLGTTANFVTSGGTNGSTNSIILTGVAAGFISQGTYFDGSSYAWMNGSGAYVRGINYGVDAGTATSGAATSLAGVNHQQFTGAISAEATNTFLTLKDSGNNNFTLAGGATVTVNGILKAGNVAGGATISGGTAIKAATSAELAIRADGPNDALTISTPIIANGINALTKSGAGTLTLTGANSYSGGTNIGAGTLSFANGSLGSSGNITFTGNSTLQWNGTNTQDISSRLQIVDGATATFDTQANNVTLASNITIDDFSFPVGLTKAGSGMLTLSGSNSFYNGISVTVSAGTLAIGNASALNPIFGTTTVSLGDANTTANNSSPSLLLGGAFSLGNVVVQNQPTLGTYTIGGNTASTSSLSSVTLNQPVTLSQTPGGTLNVQEGVVGNGNTLTASGGGNINFTSIGISGAGTSLVVNDSGGIVTLSAPNTYTGATTVSAGKLTLTSNSSLGATAITVASGATLAPNPSSFGSIATGSLSLSSGATFDMSGDGSVGRFNPAGLLSLSGATLKFDLSQTTTDQLNSTGTPVVTGTNTITIVGGAASVSAGTYSLITATAGTALGTANFTLATTAAIVNGQSWHLALGTTPGTAEQLIVTPGVNGAWTQTGSGSPYSWGAGANWAGGVVPGAVADAATFGSATANNQTINLDQARTVGAVNFNNSVATATAGNYTLAGNGFTLTLDAQASPPSLINSTGSNTISAPLALNATPNISVASGTQLSLTGPISNGTSANGLTIAGPGTLALSGANTYSGPTTLSSGTLNINGAQALGTGTFVVNGGTINNTSGAPITLTNNNPQTWASAVTFTGTNDVNLGTGAVNLSNGTVTVTSGTLTVGGVVSGGSLRKFGAGTLNLTGANVLNGFIVVYAGTLSLNQSNNGQTALATGPLFELYGGTLSDVGASNTNPLGFVTQAFGAASVTTSGTTGHVFALGTVEYAGGTISLSPFSTVNGAPGSISGSFGGANGIAGCWATYSATAGGATDWIDTSSSTVKPYTSYSSDSFASAAANTNITANDSPATPFTINSLRFNAATPVTLTIPTGVSVLTLGGILETSAAGRSTTGDLISGGTLTAGSSSGTLFVQQFDTSAPLTIAAAITDNGGSAVAFVKAGPGKLILSGANTYSGGTTIVAGTLSFANGSLGSSGNITFTGNSTLQWNGTNTQDISSRLKINDSVTATLDTQANNVTLASNIDIFNTSFPNGLTKSGSGTLILSGSNNFYDTVFTVSAGALVTDNSNALNASFSTTVFLGDANTTANNSSPSLLIGGAFGFGQSVTVQNQPTSGTYTIGGNTANVSNFESTITLNQPVTLSQTPGGTLNVVGAIVGNGNVVTFAGGGNIAVSNSITGAALTVADPGGTVTISNPSNTFTGGTNINSGTLSFASGALGSSGAITFTGNSILQWSAGNTQDISIRLAINNGVTATFDTQGNSVTLASGFGGNGSGSLTKIGSGTLTLAGANNFTGGVTINAGVLQLGAAGALNATTPNAVTFGPGSTGALALAGNSVKIGDLNSNATVGSPLIEDANGGSVSNATLTVAGTGADTFAGVLQNGGSGTLSLTKAGANSLTLTAASSYSGTTTISAGTLLIGASVLSATNSPLGNSSGAILLGDANTPLNASPSLLLGGAFNVTRPVTIQNFTPAGVTYVLGNNTSSSGSFSALITLNAPLTINQVAGAGGTTAVNGGITGNGNALVATAGASSAININSGITGNGTTLTSNGAGTVTLNSGSNTYSGATTVSAGVLQVQVNNAIPAASQLIVTGSGIVDLLGVSDTVAGLSDGGVNTGIVRNGALTSSFTTGNQTFSGVIKDGAGTTAFSKSGGGTQILTGANIYSGATNLTGGTLTAGATNTLSANSAVTVSGGTLDVSGFANQVAALTVGGGGTLRIGLGNTLSSTGIASFAGTLTITGTPTLGAYALASYSSETGAFSSATSFAGYALQYGASQLTLVRAPAMIGTILATPTSASIITGGSTPFTFTVQNSAPANSLALQFSAASGTNTSGSVAGPISVAAGSTSGPTSGLSYTGTTVGMAQSGSFTVSDSAASNSPQTGSMSVNVLGHATDSNNSGAPGSFAGGTLNLGNIHQGYAAPVVSSNSLIVQNGTSGDIRAALAGSGAQTGGTTAGLTLNAIGGSGTITAGQSTPISATLATGLTAGAINQQFTYTFSDDSSLNGASSNVGTATITVVGTVYTGLSTWTGASGGAWANFANWNSGGAPGLDPNFTTVDTATLGATAGNVTIDLHGAAPSLNALTFNGTGSYTIVDTLGTGSLALAGSAPTIIAAGTQTISVPVTLAANASVAVSGGSDRLTISGVVGGANKGLTLTGAGTLTLTAANTYSGATSVNGGTMTFSGGGKLTQAGAVSVGASGIAGQSGTLTVDGNGSAITLSPAANFTVGQSANSSGVLNVSNNGTFTVGAGGQTALNATGTININGGGVDLKTLGNNGGAINLNSGSLSFLGSFNVGVGGPLGQNLTLDPSKSLTLSGATTIDAFKTLTLSGGTLSTGTLVNNGALLFTSGALDITGAGGLTFGSGGALGNSYTLASAANLNVTNTTSLNSGASLDINGGSFTSSAVVNSGSLTLDAGSLAVSGSLTNNVGGFVYIGQNKVATVGGASSNAGEIQLGGASALLTGAGSLANTGLLHGDGVIAVPVTNNAGGEIRAESGKRIKLSGVNGPDTGNLNLQGGTAEFSQPLTIATAGQINGQGTLILPAGQNTGTGANQSSIFGLADNGTIQFSGGDTNIYGSVNLPGVANMSGTITGPGTGKLLIGAGANTVSFYGDVWNNGNLFRTAAGSYAVFFGNVHGASAFSGGGTVDFEGTFLPGNSPAAVAIGGNAIFGVANTLDLDIGGTTPGNAAGDYAQINVTGAANLGGTLNLIPYSGFTPVSGDKFTVLTYGSATGTFSSISGATPAPGLTYSPVYQATSLVLLTTTDGDKTWGVDASGNSSLAANWIGGVAPGGVGDSVAFTTIITAPRIVTLDADTTVGTLKFDSPNNYTISGTHLLTLQAAGAAAASIDVSAVHGNGAHTISAPIAVASDLNITQNSTGTLRLTGTVNDLAAHAIALSGPGTTEIDGTPTFGPNTKLTINSGTLRFGLTTTPAAISAGVTATVVGGATLELAGTASALGTAGGNRANIVNNSVAAGLVVDSGSDQVVGDIDGSGSTQVGAGSELTANRIDQNALIIGGTAGSPAVVTIDASNPDGTPTASAGFALAGSLTPSIAFAGGAFGSSSLLAGTDDSSFGDQASLGGAALGALHFGAAESTEIGDSAAAVPEPSTLVLLILGGLACCLASLRRTSRP